MAKDVLGVALYLGVSLWVHGTTMGPLVPTALKITTSAGALVNFLLN